MWQVYLPDDGLGVELRRTKPGALWRYLYRLARARKATA